MESLEYSNSALLILRYKFPVMPPKNSPSTFDSVPMAGRFVPLKMVFVGMVFKKLKNPSNSNALPLGNVRTILVFVRTKLAFMARKFNIFV